MLGKPIEVAAVATVACLRNVRRELVCSVFIRGCPQNESFHHSTSSALFSRRGWKSPTRPCGYCDSREAKPFRDIFHSRQPTVDRIHFGECPCSEPDDFGARKADS